MKIHNHKASDGENKHHAENTAAAERERLLVTLRSIGDGVISTDVNGHITLMNRIAEELTGWSSAQALGKPMAEIFKAIDAITRHPLENPARKVLETGAGGLTTQTVLIARNGSERIVENSGTPMMDEHNNIIGVVLVLRDITDRQKTEDALSKAEKLESLGVLAGGIAHDFNNLLGGLFGYLDMVREHCQSGEYDKIPYNVAKAFGVFSRARDLTQQLLTFAKGGKPIKKVASMTSLLRQSAQFALSGSNIELNMNLPGNLWPCEVDDNQIGQVIDNIVINARQAMPTGGLVTISAENIDEGLSIPADLQPGDYVCITIMDNGTGIPREHLPRIFDPFFTTKQQGSGLGLATTYSIMKNHEGLIEVASELGKGTAFKLFLPASKDAVIISEIREQDAFKATGRILVMDDEESIREISASMLKRIGFTVECAANGEEAVRMHNRAHKAGHPFDLVILDLTIPSGKGGKETIAELKKHDPSVVAIASSGYSEDPIMANPTEYGFSGRLVKPYRKDDLIQVLRPLVKEEVNAA